MDLPADDDGPSLGSMGSSARRPRKKAKAAPEPKPRQPRRPTSRTSGGSAAAVLGGLPPDDEHGASLFASGSNSPVQLAPAAPCSMGEAGSANILPCEHASLREAALAIPSQVHMPHDDIRELAQHANPSQLRCTLWEIFSVPRLGPILRAMGGSCRRSYDIKHFWDLGDEAYARTLLQDVAILQPLFLMMSPPCTWVCQLMHSNWGRIAPDRRFLNLLQACHFIDLCMWLAMLQIGRGDLFAVEHPAGSLAWSRKSVP